MMADDGACQEKNPRIASDANYTALDPTIHHDYYKPSPLSWIMVEGYCSPTASIKHYYQLVTMIVVWLVVSTSMKLVDQPSQILRNKKNCFKPPTSSCLLMSVGYYPRWFTTLYHYELTPTSSCLTISVRYYPHLNHRVLTSISAFSPAASRESSRRATGVEVAELIMVEKLMISGLCWWRGWWPFNPMLLLVIAVTNKLVDDRG